MYDQAGGIRVERPESGCVVVVLTGEHDLATKGALETCLGSVVETNDLVVVDLSETVFIDSTALHVLVQADRAARDWGHTFRLQVDSADVVHRTLEVSGLLQRLHCSVSREEALRLPMSELPHAAAAT